MCRYLDYITPFGNCNRPFAQQPKAAHLAVMMPFLMLNRYGDGLLEVLFGFKSPREAFEAVGS